MPVNPPNGNNGNCVAGFAAVGAIAVGAIGADLGFNLGAAAGASGGTLAEPGGGTIVGGVAGGAAGGLAGGALGGNLGYRLGASLGSIVCASSETGAGGQGNSGAQDKKLSPSEVTRLESETGESAHQIKTEALGTNKNIAQYDLYKDAQGKVFVKAKGGVGEAIPTGLRIY
jgi:hypothetical protein